MRLCFFFLSVVVSNAIPFVGFGFLDNAIMICAVSAVKMLVQIKKIHLLPCDSVKIIEILVSKESSYFSQFLITIVKY